MDKGIQEWTKKICGKQPLKNLKWYGLPKHCLKDCLQWIVLGPILNTLIQICIKSKNLSTHNNYILNVCTKSLRKVFILTTSGNQSSNNCKHIAQWKIDASIFRILNILNLLNCPYFKNLCFPEKFLVASQPLKPKVT